MSPEMPKGSNVVNLDEVRAKLKAKAETERVRGILGRPMDYTKHSEPTEISSGEIPGYVVDDPFIVPPPADND